MEIINFIFILHILRNNLFLLFFYDFSLILILHFKDNLKRIFLVLIIKQTQLYFKFNL